MVNVTRDAIDRLLANLIRQGESRLLATSVFIAACLAKLIVLQGVDGEQADALPMNLDRIAVNDRGLADEVRRGRGWRERQHGERVKGNQEAAHHCHPYGSSAGGWLGGQLCDAATCRTIFSTPVCFRCSTCRLAIS